MDSEKHPDFFFLVGIGWGMEGVRTGGDSPEKKAALSTPTGFPGPARFKAPQSHLTVPL